MHEPDSEPTGNQSARSARAVRAHGQVITVLADKEPAVLLSLDLIIVFEHNRKVRAVRQVGHGLNQTWLVGIHPGHRDFGEGELAELFEKLPWEA